MSFINAVLAAIDSHTRPSLENHAPPPQKKPFLPQLTVVVADRRQVLEIATTPSDDAPESQARSRNRKGDEILSRFSRHFVFNMTIYR